MLIDQYPFLATAWEYPWLTSLTFFFGTLLLAALAMQAAHKSNVATSVRSAQLWSGLAKVDVVLAVVSAAMWGIITSAQLFTSL